MDGPRYLIDAVKDPPPSLNTPNEYIYKMPKAMLAMEINRTAM